MTQELPHLTALAAQQGRRFRLRTERTGAAGAGLRAAGVAAPPTVQQLNREPTGFHGHTAGVGPNEAAPRPDGAPKARNLGATPGARNHNMIQRSQLRKRGVEDEFEVERLRDFIFKNGEFTVNKSWSTADQIAEKFPDMKIAELPGR